MRILDNGCAYWSLGSIVEVSLHTENHDPNMYRARCLTGGTFPTIKVLDDKYPDAIEGRATNPLYAIWRELSDEESVEEVIEESIEEPVEESIEEPVEETTEESTALCSCGNLVTSPKGAGDCDKRHIGVSEDFAF